MGRRVNKVKPRKKEMEWIFQVNVQLTYNDEPKIAFLSGLERSYYPEDPGCSKFGNAFQINCLEEDGPPCNHYFPQYKPTKPISTKGYGIGGLNGPRFPKLIQQSNPSPDKYQPELVRPTIPSRRRKVPVADDFFKLAKNDPFVRRNMEKLAAQRSRQCFLGFGSLKSMSRFGPPPPFNTAGVGSYNISMKEVPTRLESNASFGRSPVIHKEATEIRCVFNKIERCIECGKELDIADHYRTRFPVEVPLPETRNPSDLEEDFPRGRTCVNLCNVCYFRALQGHSKNWPKDKLLWTFKKVRTCASVHEHHDLTQIIHKANCKTIRRLRRKETILAKYYSDHVAESLPARVY